MIERVMPKTLFQCIRELDAFTYVERNTHE